VSNQMPLTGDDLRVIADAVDAVDRAEELRPHGVLGRFEVHRPESVYPDLVGWVERFDYADPDMGWGFVPKGADDDR